MEVVEGQTQVVKIEPPDLDNLEPWLNKHVKRYFKGFEDKRHADGTPLGEDELIEESKQQLRMVADGFKEMGTPDNEIKEELVAAVRPLPQTEPTSERK